MQGHKLLRFICLQIYFKCLVQSIPIDDLGKELERKYEPIALEMGKDYTQTELSALFAQQVQGSPTQSVPENTSPTFTKDTTSGDLETDALFISTSFCDDAPPVPAIFSVHIEFDGNQAHYSPFHNVDGFGYISLTRINRQSLHSTAEFHRTMCAAPDPQTMCSYYHHVILTADITTQGVNRGIKVGAIQPETKAKEGTPWVLKTCVRVAKGTTGRCPAPDLRQTVCRMLPIEVVQRR